MYITRFTTTENTREDYFYHTLEEAQAHLHLFSDDDSGIYQSIAVIDDDTGKEVITMQFIDGVPQAPVISTDF